MTVPTSSPPDQSKIAALDAWFAENGLLYNTELVEIASIPPIVHGVGILSRTDINKDERIATIPKKIILSLKNSALGDKITQHGIVGGEGLALALVYEFSQQNRSFWRPYLDTLPLGLVLPYQIDESNFKYIRGTMFESELRATKAKVREIYDGYVLSFYAKYANLVPAPFQTFVWYMRCCNLVLSRSFLVDQQHGISMVPFADIFNHRSVDEHIHIEGDECDESPSKPHPTAPSIPTNSTNTTASTGASSSSSGEELSTSEAEHDASEKDVNIPEPLETQEHASPETMDVRLVRAVKKGEELFNIFGSKPNASLLNRYGFAEAYNPNDACAISEEIVWKVLEEYFIAQNKAKKRFPPRGIYLAHYNKRKMFITEHLPIFEPDSEDGYLLEASGGVNTNLMYFLYMFCLPDMLFDQYVTDQGSFIHLLTQLTMDEILDVEDVCPVLTRLVIAKNESYGEAVTIDMDTKLAEKLLKKKRKTGLFSIQKEFDFYSVYCRLGEKRHLKAVYESIFSVPADSSTPSAGMPPAKRLKTEEDP